MKIARVLHAGLWIEHEKTRVLFDPLFETPFSRNCYANPPVQFDEERLRGQRFSAVVISHFHDDHLSLESLDMIDRVTPIYLFSVHEEFFQLLKEMGFRNVFGLTLDVPVKIGPISITPRRALNADVDSIFEITTDFHRILNVVDSWIPEDTLGLLKGPWDLVLWPFQTLREREALCPDLRTPATGDIPQDWYRQWQILKPKAIVPSSCQFLFEKGSWLNHEYFPISYEGFAQQVKRIAAVIALEPGVVWELQESLKPSGRLDWVWATGPLIDYDYRPQFAPTPVREIAKTLPPFLQKERVRAWIQEQDWVADSSFGDRYRISIFDETGDAEHFDFERRGESWFPARDSKPPDVTTEIPGVKLLSVLETGESLTSIQARVRITGRIVREDFDPISDPLLQALYGGDVAVYQRGQMRKLNESFR